MTPARAPQPRSEPTAGAEPGVAAGAHALPVEALARELGVRPERGLDSPAAARRLAEVGRNEIEPAQPTPLWRMVVLAATEPFVLLLLAAGALAVLLGETRDGLLVMAGLVPIVGADVITEYRGERALEALRDATAPRARVRRDGEARDVAAAELVPGDVVILRGGDVVPADLRVIRTDRLQVDRSILTGESVPELATAEPDPPGAELADRHAMAFSGTSVVGGRGEGLVVATGSASEVGRIAGQLGRTERRRSPVQAELDRLVRILLTVAVGLIVIVTGLGFLRGQPAGENLLAGIAAAIAAIPEEPPILLAVILGLGAYRLMRRGVLVRRLNAEEVLGAIDLIVTDKTGTLTRNTLEVRSVVGPAGPIDDPDDRRAILEAALCAEDDAWGRRDGLVAGAFTRSLARAVEAAGGSADLDPAELVDSMPAGDGRPFSSAVCRVDGGPAREQALGAPEAIFELAGGVDGAWHERVTAGTEAGERIVALAGREPGGRWETRALIGFADPPRDGIREALATATGAGIQTIVVTGDHPATAAAIAASVGLETGRVVTGTELESWDDARLTTELPDLRIVARSSPALKERIVRSARASGRMVAVTGDGVNDAPALSGADVAVAMGSGTAVAREAADLVLGDDSFATLMFGLAEGRRIVDNVQKGLVFLVSTHVALLGFLLIATIAGFGQPLLPIQILWLELFIDVSASAAFEREPPEPDLMRRPPRDPRRPLLANSLLVRIAGAGGFSAFAALVLILLPASSLDHARWWAFTTLVVAQVVRAYANRSLAHPVHRLAANRLLAGAIVLVLVIQVAIPYLPPLAEIFRASPLDAGEWLLVAAVAVAPALVSEVIRSVRRTVWVA